MIYNKSKFKLAKKDEIIKSIACIYYISLFKYSNLTIYLINING
jgi:hypothetical protein